MAEDSIPRRSFLQGAGAAGTAVATALSTGLATRADAQSAPSAQRAGSAVVDG
jgi:TAT (twin-arginine translocation) pathway signal sequence